MSEYQLLDVLAHARMKSILVETSIKYEEAPSPSSPSPFSSCRPVLADKSPANSRDNFPPDQQDLAEILARARALYIHFKV
jgi:hypothetical protein